METRIDTIVREIVELDPELKTHETELRALIRHMETAHPRPLPREEFVVSLRRKLLQKPLPVRSPFMNPGWLLMRLVPIGAVALLVFMLTPSTPPFSPTGEYTSNDPRILRIEQGGSGVTSPRASDPTMVGFGGMEGDTTMQTESVPESMMYKSDMGNTDADMSAAGDVDMFSTIQAMPEEQPSRTLIAPAVTVSEPSFIVIHESTPYGEQFIGVSPLLNVGTSERVPVYLERQPMFPYHATLYRDNGDGFFSEASDLSTEVAVTVEG